MKRCALITAFIVAAAFISTSVYAAEQKDSKKDAAPEKAKAAAPQAAAFKVTPKAVPQAPKVVPQTAPQAAPQAAPQKKLTKEEMVSRINEMLKNRPNIVSAIQGLQAAPAGGYTYNGKKIGELDEETLFKLLSMINQQISLDNLQRFDRQQRQLKNIQQIDRINKAQRTLKQQQTLTRPSTPKSYAPPKIPRTR